MRIILQQSGTKKQLWGRHIKVVTIVKEIELKFIFHISVLKNNYKKTKYKVKKNTHSDYSAFHARV